MGVQDVSGHIKPSGNLEGLQTIDSGLLDSPTGFGLRNDTGGLGHYGAPRGNRLHTGLDFKSIDGQNITSPIDGTVINRIGDSGPLVDIYPNNPNIGFDRMQILYVDSPPNILSDVTRNINAGDVIGNSLNLQSLGYPTSVGPHVHLQLWKDGIKINPTKFFFK